MSLAALVGLALGTAAMTVVLSAFAGLEDLILTQFEDANATLKIESATGPYVELTSEDSLFLSGLEANFEETSTMSIYEKRVLLTYGENQHIAYLWACQRVRRKAPFVRALAHHGRPRNGLWNLHIDFGGWRCLSPRAKLHKSAAYCLCVSSKDYVKNKCLKS